MDRVKRAWELEAQAVQPVLEKYAEHFQAHPQKIPHRVLRVSQLDGIILDQELTDILKVQFNKIFHFYKNIQNYNPELSLLLELILFRFSVWSRGTTYGNQLQNLKFDFPEDQFRRKLKLFGYMLVHILIPYAFNRLSLKSQQWVTLPADDPKKKLWVILTKLESFWKYLTFAHFISFLLSGKYVSAPNQLLGLRLVYASSGARHVSFDFMNRQLIWNGFSEFMFFIMPMVNVSRVKEFFRNFFQFHRWNSESGQDSEFLDKTTCGICGESPIVIPYSDAEGTCKHNYCYYCIQQKLMEGGNYTCPIDKTKIVAVRRTKTF